MAIIQIDVDRDKFTDDEKVMIAKAMSKAFVKIFNEIKGKNPNSDHLSVLIREPSTWIIGGITEEEYWKVMKKKKVWK